MVAWEVVSTRPLLGILFHFVACAVAASHGYHRELAVNAAGAKIFDTSGQLMRKAEIYDFSNDTVPLSALVEVEDQTQALPTLWYETSGKTLTDHEIKRSSCCSSDTQSASSTTAGEWRSNTKYIYSSISECKTKCQNLVSGSNCKGFVAHKSDTPKTCEFKTATSTLTSVTSVSFWGILTEGSHQYGPSYGKTANKRFATSAENMNELKAAVDPVTPSSGSCTSGCWVLKSSVDSGSVTSSSTKGKWQNIGTASSPSGYCYYYNQRTDCSILCSGKTACKGYEDIKASGHSPAYCCFKKTSAALRTESPAYAKGDAHVKNR